MPIEALEHVSLAIGERAVRKHLWRSGYLRDDLGKITNRDGFEWWDESMVKGIAKAQIFDVENVLQWLTQLEMGGQQAFAMMASLPTCVPPYTFTYLEWPDDGIRSSAYVVCSNVHNTDEKSAIMAVFDTDRTPERTIESYHIGSAFFRFTSDGRVKTLPDNPDMPEVRVAYTDISHELFEVSPGHLPMFNRAMARAFATALFTFSLLHCTNVTALEVDPRATMSRQMRREADRKGRKHLVYNVVHVKPLGSYRKSASEQEGEGHKKRLHHVRGHFAEYGPDYDKGLLFGRIAGRFWCPPHVRGTLEQGVVAKTYRLDGPTGKENLHVYDQTARRANASRQH